MKTENMKNFIRNFMVKYKNNIFIINKYNYY